MQHFEAQMRIFAMAQGKGGVGKTTLATSLAVAAEAQGERVLLLDLDPQGSSLLWSQTRGPSKPPTVIDVAPEKLGEVISAAATLNATLILIDTPSRVDALIAAAVRVSDMVVLPANPGLLSLAPLQATAALVEAAGKRDAAVGVVNNVEQGAVGLAKAKDASAVLADLGMPVAPTIVQHLPQFSAAFDRGLGVTELRPPGRAGAQIEQLWSDLDRLAKRLAAQPEKRRQRRESA
jgi:chromosome partitioning protein